MHRHSNTDPCPTCSGAQVKRKLGGMTENCKTCSGSGRVARPKKEARGAFKKKVEQVPLIQAEEVPIIRDDIGEQRKSKVKASGKVKTWSRKKKVASA